MHPPVERLVPNPNESPSLPPTNIFSVPLVRTTAKWVHVVAGMDTDELAEKDPFENIFSTPAVAIRTNVLLRAPSPPIGSPSNKTWLPVVLLK